jgi:hypothetical protein
MPSLKFASYGDGQCILVSVICLRCDRPIGSSGDIAYLMRHRGANDKTMSSSNSFSAPTRQDSRFFDLLTRSYARLLGKPLTDRSAVWLYRDAPFVVVAHNTDPDPRFVYANKAAQCCFEYGWDEFVTLPSRLSAEEMLREKRQAALEAVARDGFIAGYSGVRIAKSGRRFRITDTVIWQLVDDSGVLRGQAATFADWDDVSG